MKKKAIVLFLAALLSLSAAGCVKVVPIGQEGTLTGEVEFSASDNVASLWENAVADIESRAVDLPTLLEQAPRNWASLVDKYGKYSMGTSGSISYPVSGTGTVTEVNQEKKAGYMTVQLDGYDGPEVIKIQIGSIYKGSSTRDTLNIVSFGDYTNQTEWAEISQELHTNIDTNVIQPANPAELTGKTISFVGTFTVDGNDELLITAVKLDVK